MMMMMIYKERIPIAPSNASSSPTWLITLNQKGSVVDGVSTHYEVN
jgi:hypothetical protein